MELSLRKRMVNPPRNKLNKYWNGYTNFDASPMGNDEYSFDGHNHSIPIADHEPIHISHFSCWCLPEWDGYKDGVGHYTHRSLQ